VSSIYKLSLLSLHLSKLLKAPRWAPIFCNIIKDLFFFGAAYRLGFLDLSPSA